MSDCVRHPKVARTQPENPERPIKSIQIFRARTLHNPLRVLAAPRKGFALLQFQHFGLLFQRIQRQRLP